MASDRIFGLVALISAVAYIAAATQIQTNFFSGEFLPKLFPILIGSVAAISALVMVFKPDPEPDWPGAGSWINMALAVVVLAFYAVLLKPLGFILAHGDCSRNSQLSNLAPPLARSGFWCRAVAWVVRSVQIRLGPWQYHGLPHSNGCNALGCHHNSHSIRRALIWKSCPISPSGSPLHFPPTRCSWPFVAVSWARSSALCRDWGHPMGWQF